MLVNFSLTTDKNNEILRTTICFHLFLRQGLVCPLLCLLTRLVFQSDYDWMTHNRLKLGLATPLNIKLRTERKNIIKSTAISLQGQSIGKGPCGLTAWKKKKKKGNLNKPQLESVGNSFCGLGIEAWVKVNLPQSMTSSKII